MIVPSSQRYLVFANDNCLKFNGPQSYGLSPCDMTDTKQHFLLDNISNDQEYEIPINIINPDGVKREVSQFDNINYDFNLVYPFNSVGSCLSINKEGLQISPCEIRNNQRFNVSNIASAEKCEN